MEQTIRIKYKARLLPTNKLSHSYQYRYQTFANWKKGGTEPASPFHGLAQWTVVTCLRARSHT